MAFDPLLFCEEGFEEDLGDNGSEEESKKCDGFSKKQSSLPSIFLESDMFWENDKLASLISKEGQTHVCFSGEILDGSLMAARKEVIEWILSVRAHYGFSSSTPFRLSVKAHYFSSINPLPSRSSSLSDVNRLNLVPLYKKRNNCKLFPYLSSPRARSDNLDLIKIRGIYSERELGKERGE